MKIFVKLVTMVIALVFMAGCRSIDPKQFPVRSSKMKVNYTTEYLKTNTWHSLRIPINTNCTNITLCDKANPVWWFGHIGDPVAPPWYRTNEHCRNLKWFFRNPFHNFTQYVIGISDKDFVRSGFYPEAVSNPTGGWNFAVCKYKCLRLPYISYKKYKMDCYFGWGVGGGFGVKVNIKTPSNISPGRVWKEQHENLVKPQ